MDCSIVLSETRCQMGSDLRDQKSKFPDVWLSPVHFKVFTSQYMPWFLHTCCI